MSASGLIYAAIAIMWAAVLIPMWLRNHESATESRSAERFGQAMRVLSRKEGDSTGEHEVAEPASGDHASADHGLQGREAPREVARKPAEQPTREARKRPTVSPAQRTRQRVAAKPSRPRAPRAPLTLAQRRARTLGVLVGLMLVVTLVSVVTPVPSWSAVPFLLLTAAFIVHLRIQALQKLRRGRPAASAQSRRGSAADTGSAASREQAAGRSDRSAEAQSSDESGVVQGPSRAVVVERKGEGAAASASDDHAHDATDPEAWRPNPLPLPTYVTAPKAVRPIKVIDLTTPGAWTSGRLLDDDVADEDLLAAQVADEELDALIGEEAAPPTEGADPEGRRAVGD